MKNQSQFSQKSKLGYWVILMLITGLSTGCQRGLLRQNEEGARGNGSESPVAEPLKSQLDFAGPKKKVVILNLWNDTPVLQEGLGNYAAEELRRGLTLTQRVLIPAEGKVDLNTQDFIQGEQVKVAQLIREGRRLGVSILVIGRITRVAFRQSGDEIGLLRQKQSQASATLEVKVFDVVGGREILAVTRSGEATDKSLTAFEGNDVNTPEYRAELNKAAVQLGVANLVPELIQAVHKMTWQGRIAKIVGPKVYVNAGRDSGLMGGDILKVLTTGDDVYDPHTGTYLGRSPGQLKGTLEVVDFLGNDAARSRIHTGGNFQESDIVQLY
jgi:hypothetical protein